MKKQKQSKNCLNGVIRVPFQPLWIVTTSAQLLKWIATILWQSNSLRTKQKIKKGSKLQQKNFPTINLVQTVEKMDMGQQQFVKNKCVSSLRPKWQKINAINNSWCSWLQWYWSLTTQEWPTIDDSFTTHKRSCNTLYNVASYGRARWVIWLENADTGKGHDWWDSVGMQILCRLCMEASTKGSPRTFHSKTSKKPWRPECIMAHSTEHKQLVQDS